VLKLKTRPGLEGEEKEIIVYGSRVLITGDEAWKGLYTVKGYRL